MKSTLRNAAFLVVAVILGFVSPWLASPDDGPILYLWFNGLPTLTAQWFAGDERNELALDVTVLAAQYLALFVAATLLGRPVVKFIADFVRAHRHRSGLVR